MVENVRLIYQNTRRRYDLVQISTRYLFYGILFGFFKIFWIIGETSGLFGRPPDGWVGIATDLISAGMILYTLLGIFFGFEAFQRYIEKQNEPISPLILNALGVVVTLAFTLRVGHAMEVQPYEFQTWANLLVVGTVKGGVYALIALGYTLVYGILFMINFAHGEVMMFGGYAGYLAMNYLTNTDVRSFEDGSTLVASLILPLIIGIMFLPLERMINAYINRQTTSFQSPSWLFLFFSGPMRFAIGFAVGYGAFVGLGMAAPHIYLIVITIFGVLFIMFFGMLVSILLSILLERVAYRPLRRAPRLAPLISAIGASIFLQQVALRIFGANRVPYGDGPRILNNPPNFKISMGELGELNIPKMGLLIVVTSILLMFLLYMIIQRTRVGKAMRAVAQDKETAALMGIDVDRVIVFTFMLGAALAGAAGVMLGLRGENFDYRFGFKNGLKAFTAAVLGGIGSIPGAMFGGFFLGIVESLGPRLLAFDEAWKDAIAFSLLVLVLIFRPSGIFGAATEVKKV